MLQKNENSLLKNLLEYTPIAVFFIVFVFFKNDQISLFGRELSGFVLATLVFVPMVVIATAVSWIVLKEVSRIQLLTLIFSGSIWGYDHIFQRRAFPKDEADSNLLLIFHYINIWCF